MPSLTFVVPVPVTTPATWLLPVTKKPPAGLAAAEPWLFTVTELLN